MKKYIILGLIFVFIHDVFAQKLEKGSFLTILGVNKYIETALGKAILISFIEDPSKCDPRRGNATIKEQLNYFGNAASKIGVDFTKAIEIEQTPEQIFKHQNFKYLAKDEVESQAFIDLCGQFGVTPYKVYYEMPEQKFEDEDIRAIAALKDAMEKANGIVKQLGKRKAKLISIDDDTELASLEEYVSKYGYDEEQLERFVHLLAMFSSNSSTESSSRTNDKSYSILATFLIE